MLTAYIRTVSDSYSRPTTRNTDTFGYKDLGEVVFSRRGAEGAEDAYAYDSIGNQTNFVANPTTNSYTHNSLNQLETATVPQFYILNSPFSISHDLSGTLQGAGGVGGLLAVSLNGLFYFPAYDNNGNITKYIDESGNVVAAYEYDAFGKTISHSGTMSEVFHHRFSTKYFDSETSLYYFGYRFYSSALMRWLNRDPIEEEGGVNIYSFCLNTPVVQIDILGDTTIGQILEALFAKENTSPKLWVMGENDSYTTIVRDWSSVKSSVATIKSQVAKHPKKWADTHTTTIDWKPKMQYGFDPRVGYEGLVTSPLGTDPTTAKNEYIIYILTRIQTDKLHTSSIGSYRIAATVDEVSFKPCKAIINIWMYNEMSRRSFGLFANHWYFRNCSMQSQFMWWNWKERINFTSKGSYSDVR